MQTAAGIALRIVSGLPILHSVPRKTFPPCFSLRIFFYTFPADPFNSCAFLPLAPTRVASHFRPHSSTFISLLPSAICIISYQPFFAVAATPLEPLNSLLQFSLLVFVLITSSFFLQFLLLGYASRCFLGGFNIFRFNFPTWCCFFFSSQNLLCPSFEA